MCDPGDEHAEHVAPQPAGVDGAPADEYSRRLAYMEGCMVRYEQACKLSRDAELEAYKCQVLRDKCWSELQDARLKFSNVMYGKDFDARGLRDKADPPVRLNRANNSWEET